jgi:hypothetical protein
MSGPPLRLRGFRRCLSCGYSLTGQPVIRDAELSLFLARCPECGAAASLSDHPLLGPWSSLWAAIAAAGWWMVAGLLLLASTTNLFAGTQAVLATAAQRYTVRLSDLYWADQQARAGGAGAGRSTQAWGTVIMVNQVLNQDPARWWMAQDHDALLAASGGLAGAIDPRAAIAALPLCVVALTWGAVWGIVLNGRPGRRAPRLGPILVAPMILGFVILLQLPFIERWQSSEIGWLHDAAQSQIGPMVLVAVLVIIAALLCAGQAMGPLVARLALRLTLLPRRRRAFRALLRPGDLPPSDVAQGSPAAPRNRGASLE